MDIRFPPIADVDLNRLVDGNERRHNRGRVKHSHPRHRYPLDQSGVSRSRRRAHFAGLGLRPVGLGIDARKQGAR
jgi:hypothetical protein